MIHTSAEGGRPSRESRLLLQGGGALGSYQAGVYDALYEANIHPDWVAGISIGALNAAVIAGNPPELRVARLREFWQAITGSPMLPLIKGIEIKGDYLHGLVNQFRAYNIILAGRAEFFQAANSAAISAAARHAGGVELL